MNTAAPVPSRPRRLRTASKRLLASRIARELSRGRECYNRADQLFERLRAGGTQVGEIVETKDGQLYRFVDNFEKSNVSFKTAAVKRFELKALNKSEQNEHREQQTRAHQVNADPELVPA